MPSLIIRRIIFPGTVLVMSLMPGISDAEPATDNKTSAEVLRELQALKERVSELEEKLEQARQADEDEVAAAKDSAKSASATSGSGSQQQETERPDTGMSDDELDELASDVETRILLGETYRSEVEELMTEKAQQVYAAREAQKAENTIHVHGAVRTQYSYEDFRAGNRDRGGDFDLDTFRINLDGSIGNVLMSAEYRFYQYMDVIHHAWVGYDFTDSLQGQVGIHQVPFGILPFNSHNYFFSSNYYLGLEDDYDTGAKLIYDEGPWNLQAAFYNNDERGGVSGTPNNERYSYDVVGIRSSGEDVDDTPANAIGENNTFNGRAVYTFRHGENWATKFGVSGQYGDLHNGTTSVGDHSAYAMHLNGFYDRWNVQLQATRFEHDLDSGADRLAVGAYAFYDTIPADGTSYTANVSYNWPVDFGPVSNLTFYNDYSLITNKSGNLDDTWMNVSGFSVSAGGLFAYFDFVMARNQPFIGGSLGGNADDTNSRLNINLGYYF